MCKKTMKNSNLKEKGSAGMRRLGAVLGLEDGPKTVQDAPKTGRRPKIAQPRGDQFPGISLQPGSSAHYFVAALEISAMVESPAESLPWSSSAVAGFSF